jgi:hypothetical protein
LGIDGQRYHAQRHHFVTVLFSAGAPAPAVQALAGHASLTVTQRYAHHSREQRRAAVQVFFSLGNKRATARERKEQMLSKSLSHPGDLNPRPTVYEGGLAG